MGPPLCPIDDEDTPITDRERIQFARAALDAEDWVNDEGFPSAGTLALTSGAGTVLLGVLSFWQG